MSQQCGEFILTKQHLCEGITNEALSAYANIPVKIIFHDEFMHSAKLRKGFKLSGKEKEERADGISARLQELNVPDWQEEVERLTSQWSAYNVLTLHPANLSNLEIDNRDGGHPQNIQARYKFRYINENGTQVRRWVTVPKPSDVSVIQYVQQPYLPVHSTILADPVHEDWDVCWSRYTELPVKLITRAPNPHNHQLMNTLHELQHAVQVFDKANVAQRFFLELGSDLFPRDVFRKQMPLLGLDPSTDLKEYILQRYSTILTEDRRYQTAPAVAAVEAKETLLDPDLIDATIENIRARIFEEERGRNRNLPTRDEFVRRCVEEPDAIYSLLRRCKDKGVFADGRLSLQIVEGILEAKEYFSEGITRRPSIINRSHQVLAA